MSAETIDYYDENAKDFSISRFEFDFLARKIKITRVIA